jgi:hypothetical protein
MWADRMVSSDLAQQLLASGMATEADLRPISHGWREWAAAGDGWFSVLHGEVHAYATVELPYGGEGQDEHDRAVLALLSEQSPGQRWWLGYLDTGADDIVFPDAPKVTLYWDWHYVLVEAGPEQAATWRQHGPWSFWKGALPNLTFPADHSWLMSTLWDDDWTCIGGPAGLVGRFLHHPDLQARPVALGQDATPPGHQTL